MSKFSDMLFLPFLSLNVVYISAFAWVPKNLFQHIDGVGSQTDQRDKCFSPRWKYRELNVLWNIKQEEVFMQGEAIDRGSDSLNSD